MLIVSKLPQVENWFLLSNNQTKKNPPLTAEKFMYLMFPFSIQICLSLDIWYLAISQLFSKNDSNNSLLQDQKGVSVGLGLLIPCCAASKAAASSQILFLVGDVLPHKNMFLDTLLVQGLLVYKTVVGL